MSVSYSTSAPVVQSGTVPSLPCAGPDNIVASAVNYRSHRRMNQPTQSSHYVSFLKRIPLLGARSRGDGPLPLQPTGDSRQEGEVAAVSSKTSPVN